MRNNTSKKRSKQYFPTKQHHNRKAFTWLEQEFQEKTVRQFYDTKKNRLNQINGMKEGYDKSYAYHIKANARLLSHFATEDTKNTNKVRCQLKEAHNTLSSKGIGSKAIRASDPEARIILSKILMKEVLKICVDLKKKGMKVYKADFILPRLHTDAFEPFIDIYKLKDIVQRAIRRYTGLNCMAVVEIQPRKENGEWVIMIHVHAILWGDEICVDDFLRRARSLKSEGCRKPVIFKKIEPKKQNLVSIISYNTKSPNMHKSKTSADRKPRREEMPAHLLARHFEILSYIPLECLIFSNGSGAHHRERVLKRLGDWDRVRTSQSPRRWVEKRDLDAFWAQHWKDLGFDEYQPVEVRYKRGQ